MARFRDIETLQKFAAVHASIHNQSNHSRHWYDLVRLDDAGIAASALADNAISPAATFSNSTAPLNIEGLYLYIDSFDRRAD